MPSKACEPAFKRGVNQNLLSVQKDPDYRGFYFARTFIGAGYFISHDLTGSHGRFSRGRDSGDSPGALLHTYI